MSESKVLLSEADQKPCILFAFDGTVMNTGPAILASYRHTFDTFHKCDQFTKEAENEVINSPVAAMFAKYLPDEDTAAAVKEYNYYQRNHLIDLIQPMNGAIDLLAELKQEGYTIGIVSVRERSSLVELLQRHNMEQYIDVIIGGGHDHHTSLSTENILNACRLMKAETCIYISDCASNIVVGKSAGTFTIGFVDNPEKTYSMVEAGPDFLTGDFAQISKLIHGEPLWIAYKVLYPETEKEKEKRLRKEQKAAQKKAEKEAVKKEKKEKKEKKPSEPSPSQETAE